jgi:hypothetical protein
MKVVKSNFNSVGSRIVADSQSYLASHGDDESFSIRMFAWQWRQWGRFPLNQRAITPAQWGRFPMNQRETFIRDDHRRILLAVHLTLPLHSRAPQTPASASPEQGTPPTPRANNSTSADL